MPPTPNIEFELLVSENEANSTIRGVVERARDIFTRATNQHGSILHCALRSNQQTEDPATARKLAKAAQPIRFCFVFASSGEQLVDLVVKHIDKCKAAPAAAGAADSPDAKTKWCYALAMSSEPNAETVLALVEKLQIPQQQQQQSSTATSSTTTATASSSNILVALPPTRDSPCWIVAENARGDAAVAPAAASSASASAATEQQQDQCDSDVALADEMWNACLDRTGLNLLVCFWYGSQTGNSEYICTQLHHTFLNERGDKQPRIMKEFIKTVRSGAAAVASPKTNPAAMCTATVLLDTVNGFVKKEMLSDAVMRRYTCIHIFVCSTYGDGDFPDNASRTKKYLASACAQNKTALASSRVFFSVLALGDTNYSKFAEAGKLLNRKLKELGSTCILPIRCADDGIGLELVVDPYVNEEVWPPLEKQLGNLLSEQLVETPLASPLLLAQRDGGGAASFGSSDGSSSTINGGGPTEPGSSSSAALSPAIGMSPADSLAAAGAALSPFADAALVPGAYQVTSVILFAPSALLHAGALQSVLVNAGMHDAGSLPVLLPLRLLSTTTTTDNNNDKDHATKGKNFATVTTTTKTKTADNHLESSSSGPMSPFSQQLAAAQRFQRLPYAKYLFILTSSDAAWWDDDGSNNTNNTDNNTNDSTRHDDDSNEINTATTTTTRKHRRSGSALKHQDRLAQVCRHVKFFAYFDIDQTVSSSLERSKQAAVTALRIPAEAESFVFQKQQLQELNEALQQLQKQQQQHQAQNQQQLQQAQHDLLMQAPRCAFTPWLRALARWMVPRALGNSNPQLVDAVTSIVDSVVHGHHDRGLFVPALDADVKAATSSSAAAAMSSGFGETGSTLSTSHTERTSRGEALHILSLKRTVVLFSRTSVEEQLREQQEQLGQQHGQQQQQLQHQHLQTDAALRGQSLAEDVARGVATSVLHGLDVDAAEIGHFKQAGFPRKAVFVFVLGPDWSKGVRRLIDHIHGIMGFAANRVQISNNNSNGNNIAAGKKFATASATRQFPLSGLSFAIFGIEWLHRASQDYGGALELELVLQEAGATKVHPTGLARTGSIDAVIAKWRRSLKKSVEVCTAVTGYIEMAASLSSAQASPTTMTAALTAAMTPNTPNSGLTHNNAGVVGPGAGVGGGTPPIGPQASSSSGMARGGREMSTLLLSDNDRTNSTVTPNSAGTFPPTSALGAAMIAAAQHPKSPSKRTTRSYRSNSLSNGQQQQQRVANPNNNADDDDDSDSVCSTCSSSDSDNSRSYNPDHSSDSPDDQHQRHRKAVKHNSNHQNRRYRHRHNSENTQQQQLHLAAAAQALEVMTAPSWEPWLSVRPTPAALTAKTNISIVVALSQTGFSNIFSRRCANEARILGYNIEFVGSVTQAEDFLALPSSMVVVVCGTKAPRRLLHGLERLMRSRADVLSHMCFGCVGVSSVQMTTMQSPLATSATLLNENARIPGVDLALTLESCGAQRVFPSALVDSPSSAEQKGLTWLRGLLSALARVVARREYLKSKVGGEGQALPLIVPSAQQQQQQATTSAPAKSATAAAVAKTAAPPPLQRKIIFFHSATQLTEMIARDMHDEATARNFATRILPVSAFNEILVSSSSSSAGVVTLDAGIIVFICDETTPATSRALSKIAASIMRTPPFKSPSASNNNLTAACVLALASRFQGERATSLASACVVSRRIRSALERAGLKTLVPSSSIDATGPDCVLAIQGFRDDVFVHAVKHATFVSPRIDGRSSPAKSFETGADAAAAAAAAAAAHREAPAPGGMHGAGATNTQSSFDNSFSLDAGAANTTTTSEQQQQAAAAAAAQLELEQQQGSAGRGWFTGRIVETFPLTSEVTNPPVIFTLFEISGRSKEQQQNAAPPMLPTWEPGDAIQILPENDPDEVDDILAMLNVSGDESFLPPWDPSVKDSRFPTAPAYAHIKFPATARDVLRHHLSLKVHNKEVCTMMERFVTNPQHRLVIRALLLGGANTPGGAVSIGVGGGSNAAAGGAVAAASSAFGGRRDVPIVEVLHQLGDSARLIPLRGFVETLPTLQPRCYSITTAPAADPKLIGIAFKVVKGGVCTNWLARLCQLASEQRTVVEIPLRLRTAAEFRMPRQMSSPMILIGPGTGVAPFLSFLSHREVQLAKLLKAKQDDAEREGRDPAAAISGITSAQQLGAGPIHLYFGCRSKYHDYLFEADLQNWKQCGVLSGLHVAFSQDSNGGAWFGGLYVQDLLRESGPDLSRLIVEEQAHVYVCGDASSMAKDVHQVLVDILCEFRGMSTAQAQTQLREMEENGAYQRDIWS